MKSSKGTFANWSVANIHPSTFHPSSSPSLRAKWGGVAYPSWLSSSPRGHIERQTATCSHSFRQFTVPSPPLEHAFGQWEEDGVFPPRHRDRDPVTPMTGGPTYALAAGRPRHKSRRRVSVIAGKTAASGSLAAVQPVSTF